jgi:hypothetical protein
MPDLSGPISPTDSRSERLCDFLRCHTKLYYNDTLKTGRPILNAAVDVDDTNRFVFKKVKHGVDKWRRFLCKIVAEGKRKEEINGVIDPDESLSIIFI